MTSNFIKINEEKTTRFLRAIGFSEAYANQLIFNDVIGLTGCFCDAVVMYLFEFIVVELLFA